MEGERIDGGEEWIGVAVTDGNGVEHRIAVERDGSIRGHAQDGYPDDATARTPTNNERVNRARRFARYYVYAHRGHPTLPPHENPDVIGALLATVAGADRSAVEGWFGDLRAQLLSPHDPDVDPVVEVPVDHDRHHVTYRQCVYLVEDYAALARRGRAATAGGPGAVLDGRAGDRNGDDAPAGDEGGDDTPVDDGGGDDASGGPGTRDDELVGDGAGDGTPVDDGDGDDAPVGDGAGTGSDPGPGEGAAGGTATTGGDGDAVSVGRGTGAVVADGADDPATVEAVSEPHAVFSGVGTDGERVLRGADPRDRPPEVRLELWPLGPSRVDLFDRLLEIHLRCQVRDCYLAMGADPPAPYRVLGPGLWRYTKRYTADIDFYEPYHVMNADVEGYRPTAE